jgi:hypothetical protein
MEMDAHVRAHKNSIINRMFLETADNNYILARVSLQNGMFTEYFWLLSQAIEKYAKAILLANNRSAKPYGHNLPKLFEILGQICGDFLITTFDRPKMIRHDVWTDWSVVDFINILERYGNTESRYGALGYVQHFEFLFQMDQLIFSMRRLVIDIDGWYMPPSDTFEGVKSRALLTDPRFTPSHSGPIEKIKSGDKFREFRDTFLDLNFPFAPPNRSHGKTRIQSASSESILYLRLTEPLQHGDAEYAEIGMILSNWVLDNIYFGKAIEGAKKIDDQIRDLMKDCANRYPHLIGYVRRKLS